MTRNSDDILCDDPFCDMSCGNTFNDVTLCDIMFSDLRHAIGYHICGRIMLCEDYAMCIICLSDVTFPEIMLLNLTFCSSDASSTLYTTSPSHLHWKN